MTDLADAFGEDFAEQYQKKKQKRLQERNSVSEEELRNIAEKAASGAMGGDEPMFQYQTENGITHDVLLMEVPELNEGTVFSTYMNELESGAVSFPMDYLGEWVSCLFNNPDDVTGMKPGHQYLIVGNLDQYEYKGEMRDQVSPVRGVISLPEVKEWTVEKIDDAVNDPEPELEAPDDDFNETDDPEDSDIPEPEEEESEPSGSMFDVPSVSDDEDDDEPEEENEPEEEPLIDEDRFREEFDLIYEHKEDTISSIEPGDEALEHLINYLAHEDQLNLEGTIEEGEALEELIFKTIEEKQNEGEDEEEDNPFDSVEDNMFG